MLVAKTSVPKDSNSSFTSGLVNSLVFIRHEYWLMISMRMRAMSKSDESDKKKIISVTMSQSLVNRIDGLVQERVGRSRAQLIEDSVRWFLDFTVHKWNERGIYVNSFRAVFESETLSSLFFSALTPTDQYELGETAGKQAPVAEATGACFPAVSPNSY